jgi:pantothenate kinase
VIGLRVVVPILEDLVGKFVSSETRNATVPQMDRAIYAVVESEYQSVKDLRIEKS